MATRTIDTKIALSGEKEFNSQMKAVNSNLKTLKSDMSLVSSEFKGAEDSTEALVAKQKILEQQTAQQREKVKAYADMLAKVTAEYGENSAQADKYRQAMNSAQAQLNTFNRELESNTEKLKQTSILGTVRKHYQDLGDAIRSKLRPSREDISAFVENTLKLGEERLVSGLKKTAEGVRKLAAEAAGMPLDLIKGTASALYDVSKAVIAETMNAAGYADDVLTMSTNTGIATDALQEYMYMAERTDTSVELITGSQKKLTMNMANARDGSKAATDAFNRLNVSFMNQDGTLRESTEVFNDVITALGEIPEGTERDAIAMDLFGKNAQELNSLIAVGGDGLAQLADEARKSGAVLSESALSSLGAVSDAKDHLQKNLEAMKTAIGAQFAEPVAGVLDGLALVMQGDVDKGLDMIADALDKGAEILEELLPIAEETLQMMVGFLVQHLPDLVESGAGLLTALIGGIADTLPELVPVLIYAITTIVDTLTSSENLQTLMEAGVQLFIQLVLAIAKSIPELIPVALEAIDTIFKTLWDNRDALKDVGKELIHGLWNGITDVMEWLWDKITGFAGKVVDKVKGALGIHSPSTVFRDQIGKNLALGVGEGFEDGMDGVAKEMENAIPKSFDFNVNARGRGIPGMDELRAYVVEHTGTIRVEGVTNSGELVDVVELLVDQMRREARI